MVGIERVLGGEKTSVGFKHRVHHERMRKAVLGKINLYGNRRHLLLPGSPCRDSLPAISGVL